MIRPTPFNLTLTLHPLGPRVRGDERVEMEERLGCVSRHSTENL